MNLIQFNTQIQSVFNIYNNTLYYYKYTDEDPDFETVNIKCYNYNNFIAKSNINFYQSSFELINVDLDDMDFLSTVFFSIRH